MDERLRELRLREERTFLSSVERGGAAEQPPGRRHSRAPAIVPEPLPSDAALRLPGSPTSRRYRRGPGRGGGIPGWGCGGRPVLP